MLRRAFLEHRSGLWLPPLRQTARTRSRSKCFEWSMVVPTRAHSPPPPPRSLPSSAFTQQSNVLLRCGRIVLRSGSHSRSLTTRRRDWSPSSGTPQAFPTLNTSDVASSRSNGKTSRGDEREDALRVRRRGDDTGSQRGQRCEQDKIACRRRVFARLSYLTHQTARVRCRHGACTF